MRSLKEESTSRIRKNSAFTMVELMIVMLLISALGIGVANYMRRSTSSLSSSDSVEDLTQQKNLIQTMLNEDLAQAVFLNPSCAPNSTANTPCSDVKVRAGITPLPGLTREGVDLLTDFLTPSSWNEAASTLNETSDAIRILQYDFDGVWNCRLNRDHVGANPSNTAGNGLGAERLWLKKAAVAGETACDGNIPGSSPAVAKIRVGALYIISEEINGVPHSNLFQITALDNSAASEIQVDVASSGNLFNQVGGLGRSAYTSAARVYPVKFVEWARDSNGNLLRREIIPSEGNTGYQAWISKAERVDALHFSFLTFQFNSGPTGSADPATYQRTFAGMSGNPSDDAIEDIRGVGVRFVLSSAKVIEGEDLDDNPVTAAVENDDRPRREFNFFVQMRNRTAGGS